MQIITVSPPRLDPQDIPGSFRRMGDYFREVMELIDFTLGKYGGQLRTVDADGVNKTIEEIRSEIVKLQRDFAGQDNRMNAQESGLEEAGGRLDVLEAETAALASGAEALGAGLAALEARVAALEANEQGG